MKRPLLLLVIVCLLSVSLLQPIRADCSCQQGKSCFNIIVNVLGSGNYSVHDELVIIRQKMNNTNATHIICENRTDGKGIAHFSLENGTYWVDVRNVWAELTFDDDVEFTYPYLLYKDLPSNETNNESKSQGNYLILDAVLMGIMASVILIIIVKMYLIKKKEKK